MRFLVVDDSSTMRRILINALNTLGHDQIVEASNGLEGLERLATSDVDFIITDRNMPYMSGIEFIRTVRTIAKSKDTPVRMVTTHAATKILSKPSGPASTATSSSRSVSRPSATKSTPFARNTLHQQERCDSTHGRAIS